MRITRYEYETLYIGKFYNGVEFTEAHLNALGKFYSRENTPYYRLEHQGVRFSQYVGTLQVGNLTIEVLPKADKHEPDDEHKWQAVLVDMLKAVGIFKVQTPGSAALHLKSNFVLDLYFELFINEVSYLQQRGLIKKYRKTEGNSHALKGSLHFSQHLKYNLVNQQRFYVRHTTYDSQHIIHQLLYKTLQLLKRVNQNTLLQSKIEALLLHFPSMPDLNVTEATFSKVSFNRSNAHYQTALNIACLLLLNYHPDFSQGQNHVLALMFDMNKLWEKFVYISLKKHQPEQWTVEPQQSKDFWKADKAATRLRPDIVIKPKDSQQKGIVIDTKWKNIGDYNPSPEDLRQLYTYLHYFNAQKAALLYPGRTDKIRPGYYYPPAKGGESNEECNIITIATKKTVSEWQKVIARYVFE